MDIHDVRRNNLQYILDSRYPGAGQQVRFSEDIGWKPQRTSALVREKNPKGMGGTAARLIEQHFNLPRGWLDEAHSNLWAGKEGFEIAEASPVYVSQIQALPLLSGPEIANWCAGNAIKPKSDIAFPILPMMELSARAYVIEETTNSMPPQKPGDFYYVDPEQPPEPGKWAVYLLNHKAITGIYEMGNNGPRLTFTNPREPEIAIASMTYAGRVLTRMDGSFVKNFK